MQIPGIEFGLPTYTTLLASGNPADRIDVTILGDGYTSEQQDLFNQDAKKVVDAFARTEPISSYQSHFNFHRINLVSKEPGSIDLYARPRQFPNTALKTFFSPISRRRLVGPDPWVKVVARASGAPWDKLLVIVNTPRHGAATLVTMSVGYASRNSRGFPEIMVHEAGHTIARLIDEYQGDLPDLQFADNWSLPNFLPWANVTTNWKRPKWRRWLSAGVERPTPDISDNDGVVGAFQGAVYTGKGVYRPQRKCLMRNHRDPFCAVCSEQWIKAIYKRTKIADGFSPTFQRRDTPIEWDGDAPLPFKAHVLRGRDIHTTWQIKRKGEGTWQQAQVSQDYQDFTVQLPADREGGLTVPTTWLVEVTLEDGSDRIRTPSIRRLSRQKKRWTVITR